MRRTVRSDRGQPRPSGLENTRMPSAAERTRTLVQSTMLRRRCRSRARGPRRSRQLTPGARTVAPTAMCSCWFPAGSPAVRAATYAQDDDLTAVMEITDVAPVSVPQRIRGRAWVAGWLTSVPALAAAGARPALRSATAAASEVGRGRACDDLWGAGRRRAGRLRAGAPRSARRRTRPSCSSICTRPTASRCGGCAPCWASGRSVVRGPAAPPCRWPSTGSACGSASSDERVLRRALRLPRAGARRLRAAPRDAHPLRGGVLLTARPAGAGTAHRSRLGRRTDSGCAPRSRSRIRSTTSAYRASAP